MGNAAKKPNKPLLTKEKQRQLAQERYWDDAEDAHWDSMFNLSVGEHSLPPRKTSGLQGVKGKLGGQHAGGHGASLPEFPGLGGDIIKQMK